MATWLSTAEAFREIVRTIDPERKDLLEIDSYKWLTDRQFGEGTQPFVPLADAPAYTALETLRAGIKDQGIRLRGCLPGALPGDIDPIVARAGDLNVFAGILVYDCEDTLRTKRKFVSVHCCVEDLQLCLGRPTHDEEPRRGSASAPQIRAQIRAVYAGSDKPPNVKELPKAVRPLLHKLGLEASENQIALIGDEPEFVRLRRPRGRTIASERRK